MGWINLSLFRIFLLLLVNKPNHTIYQETFSYAYHPAPGVVMNVCTKEKLFKKK